MGKSQATFGKKENEKKRLKKRQDKEEKKEERQANAKKGQALEEMLAYVDENGNISSTPPDPKKKKEIKTEDIRIGAMKQEDMEQEDPVRKGSVTFFNDSKGYGFIKDSETQQSIFVHANALGGITIKENDKVTFEVEMGPKGPSAFGVKLQA
ncbi:cold shock domain-containing protein [Hymenobacter taeanensis]|uniref:Cold shock domain-containing protein n=1 Tax=Hymenobacter taeanensis TaxID=2735321 RepID=A0A6M6BF96_9BACT|nr:MULTISPECIES: cold shock domain-containing protein [Hymenobacter]QJX46414.1 cold shock domain-containing protein [Hymenobacter taeanensis]UOQ80275.1 cold shock domain-containing protein [Hymenobacter sp. 5414T-23]